MEKHELTEQIGKRIVHLREQRGWSQSDLARACLKDRQAIEKLEKGRVNPTIYSLFEVAKVLGIELKDLLDIKTNN